MTVHEVMRFAEDLCADRVLEADLRRAIADARDAAAALVAFACARGYAVEARELIALTQSYAREPASDELSDDDLAAVAGGTSPAMSYVFQDSAQKRQQALQTLSNLMKRQHDTTSQIINNLK